MEREGRSCAAAVTLGGVHRLLLTLFCLYTWMRLLPLSLKTAESGWSDLPCRTYLRKKYI